MSRRRFGRTTLVAFAATVLLAITATPASGGTVLIYGPSLAGSTPNEQTLAQAAGHTVTVATAAAWAAMNTAQFAQYDSIVFGDRTCPTSTALLTTALANRAVWSAAVNGPVYVQGTDPQFHRFLAQAQQMMTSGIDFVTDTPGTGLYVSLSCYYFAAPDGTQVPLLDQFGTFRVGGQGGCPSQVTIVDPSHPAMFGLTNAGLSNWGCSPHDFLLSFPSSFNTLAVGLRPSDNTRYPFIIATPAVLIVVIDIKPGSDPNSVNPRSRGVIPVAILTTSTADGDPLDFDAWDVDASTLAFGPGGAGIVHAQGHAEDVDGDGDLDMVVHFKTADTGIACGDTSATLTGQTFGGQAIEGTDSIKTVGCKSSLAAAPADQAQVSDKEMRRALRKQARIEKRLERRERNGARPSRANRPDH